MKTLRQRLSKEHLMKLNDFEDKYPTLGELNYKALDNEFIMDLTVGQAMQIVQALGEKLDNIYEIFET